MGASVSEVGFQVSEHRSPTWGDCRPASDEYKCGLTFKLLNEAKTRAQLYFEFPRKLSKGKSDLPFENYTRYASKRLPTEPCTCFGNPEDEEWEAQLRCVAL